MITREKRKFIVQISITSKKLFSLLLNRVTISDRGLFSASVFENGKMNYEVWI